MEKPDLLMPLTGQRRKKKQMTTGGALSGLHPTGMHWNMRMARHFSLLVIPGGLPQHGGIP